MTLFKNSCLLSCYDTSHRQKSGPLTDATSTSMQTPLSIAKKMQLKGFRFHFIIFNIKKKKEKRKKLTSMHVPITKSEGSLVRSVQIVKGLENHIYQKEQNQKNKKKNLLLFVDNSAVCLAGFTLQI